MTEPVLNAKLQKVYNYIVQEISTRGYAPSVREIGSACGISSSSTVHGYLKRLENLGMVKRDPAKPRAMVLAQEPSQMSGLKNGPGMVLPETQIKTLTEPSEAPSGETKPTDAVPVFPFAEIPDYYVAGEGLIPPDEDFSLRKYYASKILITEMPDETMSNINLLAGDRIAVELTETVSNGDIVLVIYQDQALVRTFYQGLKQIRLQPENDETESISAAPEELTILGKVLGLLRRF